MYWYDLVVSPPEMFDSRKIISNNLKILKQKVEDTLEKRFIYFICSRKKIRFSTVKKPYYSKKSKQLNIPIEIGKKRKRDYIKFSIRDLETESIIDPEIQITDKFISFITENGFSLTYSIHDLLRTLDLNFDFDTQVHYIGYTKNPDTRPINGAHAGLSEVLYKVSNEDSDIFIYFNLFNVLTASTDSSSYFQFAVANSMIDEIKADLEGLIIEKCLILYFDSENQVKNKKKERLELKNSLIKLSSENNIYAIHFIYEFEDESEYFRFFSSCVKSSYRHAFTVKLDSNEPIIHRGIDYFPNIIKAHL
jgi:hypothetical protein